MMKERIEILPVEVQDYIYSFLGVHDTAHIILSLFNCYNDDYYETKRFFDDVEEICYYNGEQSFIEWYFNHARPTYYEGIENRYGNKLYTFDDDKYYTNYLGKE